MKKKIRTPWIEFFKTGKFYKYIEVLDEVLNDDPDDDIFLKLKKEQLKKKKKKKEKPKIYHWELNVTLIDGHVTSLKTVNPDTEDYTGENSFDKFLEWFQCSNNPSYVFEFENGLKIFVRDKITEIEVNKKEKK